MRRLLAAVLLGLGVVLSVAAGAGVWAERQALDSAHFAETSGDLLEGDAIRREVADAVVEALLDDPETEAAIDAAVTANGRDALEEFLRVEIERELAADDLVGAFEQSTQDAHSDLVALAEDESDDPAEFDLEPLLQVLLGRLGLPAAIIAPIPDETLRPELVGEDDIGGLRAIIYGTKALAVALVMFALLAFGGAVAVAHRRARALGFAGAGLVVAGVILHVLRVITETALVTSLGGTAGDGVVEEAWSALSSLLGEIAWFDIAFGLVLMAASAGLTTLTERPRVA